MRPNPKVNEPELEPPELTPEMWAEAEAVVGLGRIVALCYCSSASHRIR